MQETEYSANIDQAGQVNLKHHKIQTHRSPQSFEWRLLLPQLGLCLHKMFHTCKLLHTYKCEEAVKLLWLSSSSMTSVMLPSVTLVTLLACVGVLAVVTGRQEGCKTDIIASH